MIFRIKHSVILVQATVSFPLPVQSTQGSKTLCQSVKLFCVHRTEVRRTVGQLSPAKWGRQMDRVFCATVVDWIVCQNLCFGLKKGTDFDYQVNNLHR